MAQVGDVKGLSAEEMDNMFDVLYNNITSNQAPGLNAYEKSIFLTKGQDEIIKNYFNPKSKGNLTQEGFDGNAKRQIDFSMLTAVDVQPSKLISDDPLNKSDITDSSATGGVTKQSLDDIVNNPEISNPGIQGFGNPLFDTRDNTKSIILPKMMMMAINEVAIVNRKDCAEPVILQVIPLKFDDYTRLMSKPYKRPLKYQAWRLINSDTANRADIIIGPSDTLSKYIIRYIKRPTPIIVSNLDGLTINGETKPCDCKLDPILHEEIVQRAVELAKSAWTSTGQDNIQAMMQAGQRSE